MTSKDLPSGVRVQKWLNDIVLVTPTEVLSADSKTRKTKRCESIETVCRQMIRRARKEGSRSIIRAHNLVCEPNFEIHSNTTPNDTYFSLQWVFKQGSDIDIDAPEAWGISTGSNSVVVGVIDTGIQLDHPDLASNIWTNPGEIASNSSDDDANGYVDDVHGLNAISNDGNLLDDNGHGTHCAGVIGGRGNNGAGVAGVNWNVGLLGCKFLSSTGSGSTADAIQCVQYMTDLKLNHGINIVVLSNSWGSTGYSASLLSAFQAAASAGIISVAAAGNDANNNDGATKNYPASFDDNSIISVAAVSSDGSLSSFSNYGATSVDLGAPGENIPSTYNSSNYVYLSGTSMATPHVAGAIALMKAAYPTLTVSQVRDITLQSTQALSSLAGKTVTGGMVNVYSMLLTANAIVNSTTTTTTTTTSTTTTRTTTTVTTTTSAATTTTSSGGATTTQPPTTTVTSTSVPVTTTTTTVVSATTTTTLDSGLIPEDPVDVSAPSISLYYATGRANRTATVAYLITDDSGATTDAFTLKKGTKTVKSYRLSLTTIPSNQVRAVLLNTRGVGAGTYQVCVVATDQTGNKSPKSCKTLKLK